MQRRGASSTASCLAPACAPSAAFWKHRMRLSHLAHCRRGGLTALHLGLCARCCLALGSTSCPISAQSVCLQSTTTCTSAARWDPSAQVCCLGTFRMCLTSSAPRSSLAQASRIGCCGRSSGATRCSVFRNSCQTMPSRWRPSALPLHSLVDAFGGRFRSRARSL